MICSGVSAKLEPRAASPVDASMSTHVSVRRREKNPYPVPQGRGSVSGTRRFATRSEPGAKASGTPIRIFHSFAWISLDETGRKSTPLRRSIQAGNATLECQADGFRSPACPQLLQNVTDVNLNGAFGDVQGGADFLVALASHHQPQDLQLPICQIDRTHTAR